MKKNLLLLPLLLLVGFATMQAQIVTPAASPSAKVTQVVGLTEVSLDYSRPSVKGRTIFSADGLVPYGKVWRTGANSATKISFSDDVTINGSALPAGSYAILTVPSATSWDVSFYAHESTNWSSYVEKEAVATVTVPSQNLPFTLESFTINIDGMSNTGANIFIGWASTGVALQLGVDVDTKVMAGIESTMAGPSANDYYNAASYYHDSGKDLKQALKWINKATAGDSPRFWQVRKKALILADLGMKKEAIAAAKQSLSLAQAAGNEDYVRMNEKSIQEWSM